MTTDFDLPLFATPDQIRRREFVATRRGYDPDQVRAYLEQLADQIAMMAAQASAQLLQRDQQAAQQQAAQQQMQDPVVQMQMQELQLRQQEVQLKAQKQQIEAAEKADRLRIEEERIKAQKEIAAMQVGATAAAAKDKLNKQMEAEGMRMGIDMHKHRAQVHQQRMASKQPVKKETK